MNRRNLLLRAVPGTLLLLVVGLVMVRLLFGEGLGPVERSVRALLGAWDMWQTPMVRPYEKPLARTPEGSLTIDWAERTYEKARERVNAMPEPVRRKEGALAYRRYCFHCHGPAGANRTIVGESFPFPLPDLRSKRIQGMDDKTLFEAITNGTKRSPALGSTTTPDERVLVIDYIRTLPGKKPVPFFPPRWVRPTQEPPAGKK